MTLISDLVFTLYCFVRAVRDAVLGRTRQSYISAVDIDAPADVVWRACSATEIVFEGPPPVAINVAPRPGSPGIFEGVITVGDRSMPIVYREIESRPEQAISIELLQQGSDPQVALGRDYYVVCTLEPHDGATRLSVMHELTHTKFSSRILVPLGARLNGRRLKTYCEKEAGTAGAQGSRLGAAVMTGALTYASFSYLFDWWFAAVVLTLLIVHEFGHALAMRLVGLPVQGIYFIPFLGGVAVSAAPHRNEAERGFVALMGPGFSILTTAVFVAAAGATGDPMFEQLAFASALLNGFNLAPVLPLDGGHVVDAAMSRSDPEFASIVNLLALMIGAGASVYMEWYVLTALLALTAPMVLRPASARRAEPITEAARNWLVAGYLATAAFYIAVAANYLG
jgi:Zn-dependent protease/uncharacterized protein YndB with AHSA1/START domain